MISKESETNAPSKGLKITIAIVSVIVAITLIACLIIIVIDKSGKTYNYSVGEKCTYLDWEITPNSIDKVEGIERTFINIDTTVKNVGTESKEFLGYSMPFTITLICYTEHSNYTYNLSFDLDNELLHTFMPLESQTDKLSFEVPNEAITLTDKAVLKITKNSQKANIQHCYDITAYML